MEIYPHRAITHVNVLDVHSGRHAQRSVAARDFYALSYRFSGEITLSAGGVRVRSTPDTVTFTPKGMPYTTAIREDTHMIVVHFRLDADVNANVPFVLPAVGTDLGEQFLRLKEAYRISDPLNPECMAILYRLLATLEKMGVSQSKIPLCVSRAREILEWRFCDAELSLTAVAQAVGVSDSYLRRAFRASYGEAPLEHLLHLRIRHAKDLLQSEFYTVAEIAARCGFHSTGYFIQCFRKQTGETPNAFRLRQRENE